ncbi:unnamed protein product [Schistosoma haematobium]|nr:unnamed protein product [Schistosoma haematobium]
MYNIIFVYLAVSFAPINAAVGNSFFIAFGNDPAILAFKNKVTNELKDYQNVEDSTANIRENEKILKAKINNLKQNLVEKRRTIEQYVRCKSKQQEAESFHGFLKDMKSNNNEEKCNQFKTFPEEDIKDLDDLIAKKYMNIKSFNNGLFIYDFAVRNVDELISLAKRIGGFL